MRIPGRSVSWALLAAVAIVGCSKTPSAPPGSGAKIAVQKYFEALMRGDWAPAYSFLDTDSKAWCSLERFSLLAQKYRSGLAFEPEAVHVLACDERDAEATAHVVLTGRANSKDRRYKDAITLRRGDDGWHIILPQNFGQAAKR